jgi:hypothetical protein
MPRRPTWLYVKGEVSSFEPEMPISMVAIQYAVGITTAEQNRRNG